MPLKTPVSSQCKSCQHQSIVSVYLPEVNVFDYYFILSLHRFAIWNTMMGTSILSIPWGIKQVISFKSIR